MVYHTKIWVQNHANSVVSGTLDAQNLANIKVLCTLEAQNHANSVVSGTLDARSLANIKVLGTLEARSLANNKISEARSLTNNNCPIV